MPGRTLRLAHRGDWRHAPENSIAAFAAALAIPACDGLEFDVRASADGVPVVCHDATLERIHGRPDRVDALSAAALEALGVPTLADVLATAGPAAVPRRRAQGGPRAGRRRAARRRPRARAVERGRVVVRGGRARADRPPRPGLATLAQQPHARADGRRDRAPASAAAGVARRVASARSASSVALAQAAGLEVASYTVRAARRSTGSRDWAWSRSASRPRALDG